MTYARARLWLGISGVGFIVVLSSVALWFGLPQRFLGAMGSLPAIALTLLCFILVSLPSDLVGGYYLPRLHGRSKLTVRAFAPAWLRGVLAQATVQGLCVLAILESARMAGRWAGVACFAVLLGLLILGQALLARLVGGLRTDTGAKLPRKAAAAWTQGSPLLLRSSDPGFVGGFSGFPGRERLILPSAWLRDLTPEALSAELIRRRGALETGARTRGVGMAIVWNVVGFAVASGMPGASLTSAAGLVQTGLWFTQWSFLGLLTLPSITRPGVLEADRFALAHGISPEALSRTISALDVRQDDEPSRSPWVERIFHPIPSVQRRVAAIETGNNPIGAWQCARVTLYLSWAGLGFLARAVHCNAGRPELWVLFPGD